MNDQRATAVGGVASFGMYPFAHLRPAWDRLWSRIAVELPGAPATLSWDHHLHDVWRDPALLLGLTCGWPLVTQLEGIVEVVGTFDPAVPRAGDGRYRSVIVAAKRVSIAKLRRTPGSVAAVNGTDSLSGWVSLCDIWGGVPDHVLLTGSHVESLRAVSRGDAQVASIDAVSFELAVESEPTTAALVRVIGHGPSVPALPIVTSVSNAWRVPVLRVAVAHAVADPEMAATCASLRIGGFVPLDRADYDELRHLMP